ncbi:hypothetical protein HJG40_12490 [Acidithiobacillus sp. ATCC 19703]|uniref:Heavy metal-binding domain-containing protein n=1 Tax=Acidithiobacillus concretivorus TaxID=3063952 RepID=A0ABS5ZSC5_9PROT|nr:hypothetical protein [Acidithiobacillus concretivorus]
MKDEPKKKQNIPLSTTDNVSPSSQIITVMNRATYGDVFPRQPDDTLAMLQEKAGKLGATGVTGVRLVPMLDERGIRVMMAYGTIICLEN